MPRSEIVINEVISRVKQRAASADYGWLSTRAFLPVEALLQPKRAVDKVLRRSTKRKMNQEDIHCFVIMPYDDRFDDVYSAIKTAVEKADGNQVIRCTRSDDKTPAGKIYDRLLDER